MCKRRLERRSTSNGRAGLDRRANGGIDPSSFSRRGTARRLPSFSIRRTGIRVDESFPSEGPEQGLKAKRTLGALSYDKFH